MSYFKALRNFVSPNKNPIHSFVSPKSSSENKKRPDRKGAILMTPSTNRLNYPITPEDSPKKAKLSDGLGVKGSRITKPAASPKYGRTSSTSAKSFSKVLNLLPSLIYKQEDPCHDQISYSPASFEGSTLFDDGTPGRSPTKEGDTTLICEDEESSNGKEISEDNESPIDSHATQLNAKEVEDGVEYKGWSEDEISLYEKLEKRGYEPLIPKSWDLDFPTFFDSFFSSDDSKVFINTVSGRKYHACKELDGLIMLGARVRDRLKANLTPEETLRRQIESYYEWSLNDADLKIMNAIPSMAIVTAAPNESVTSIVSRIQDQLHDMGSQYRDRWIDKECSDEVEQFYVHDLPTLYGIVIKHSLVSIITHDTVFPEKAVKCIGVFDFQVAGQDVWNALAVSIVLIRARNDLLVLKAEGEYELEPEIKPLIEDPDA